MYHLWKLSRGKIGLFLFLNTVEWALIGAAVWLGVQLIALKNPVWCFAFAAYLGFFVGFLGGIFYLWKEEDNLQKLYI